MRKVPFINGEFYHIYNRGVDKRDIFGDAEDVRRFLQSMKEFNVIEPIGSIFRNTLKKNKLRGSTSQSPQPPEKLVNFVCYCLNPNHYHFILEQVADRGIEKFMQRLGTGYTMYFNEKNKRSGALFQGKFKSVHIKKNSQLLHVSAYVNLNYRVHQLRGRTSQLVKSSWGEYVGEEKTDFCTKDMILGQFDNTEEYKKFAEESLMGTLERRKGEKTAEAVFME